jgi:hypothetical protein
MPPRCQAALVAGDTRDEHVATSNAPARVTRSSTRGDGETVHVFLPTHYRTRHGRRGAQVSEENQYFDFDRYQQDTDQRSPESSPLTSLSSSEVEDAELGPPIAQIEQPTLPQQLTLEEAEAHSSPTMAPSALIAPSPPVTSHSVELKERVLPWLAQRLAHIFQSIEGRPTASAYLYSLANHTDDNSQSAQEAEEGEQGEQASVESRHCLLVHIQAQDHPATIIDSYIPDSPMIQPIHQGPPVFVNPILQMILHPDNTREGAYIIREWVERGLDRNVSVFGAWNGLVDNMFSTDVGPQARSWLEH